MAQFRKSNNFVVLDFDGLIINVDSTSREFLDATDRFQKMANEVQALADKGADGIEQLTKALAKAIDDFLGEGVLAKIYEGQAVNMYDCMDVIAYILESVQEFNRAKMAKYDPVRVMMKR